MTGLLLASALATTPVHAQGSFNPGEELAKIATPAQKKKLDSLKVSLDEKITARLGAISASVTQKLYALAVSETYQPQFAEAEKLPEPEQGQKKKELWAQVAEELRPSSEKEMATVLRGLIMVYLTDVEKLMTAAQKLRFQKIKAKVVVSLDKEIPKATRAMYDSFVPGNQ